MKFAINMHIFWSTMTDFPSTLHGIFCGPSEFWVEFEFIGDLRHMQRYFNHICDATDVQADWRSCTYGRAPNAIDIGAVSRNNIKKVAPCRCVDGHVKEPHEISMALGARRVHWEFRQKQLNHIYNTRLALAADFRTNQKFSCTFFT